MNHDYFMLICRYTSIHRTFRVPSGLENHGKPGKGKWHFPDLEKSWNLKKKAKIMEFPKTCMEKSWKKGLALHAFCAELSLCAGYCNCQKLYCTFMLL